MRAAIRQVMATPYALTGLFFVVLTLISVTLRLQERVISPDFAFEWQILTGLILMSVIAYQWWLLRRRWLGKMTRKDLVLHRWMGVVATLLFIFHATRLGHTWMAFLTCVFLLVAVTGALNKEVLRYKRRGTYLVWLGVHISMSATLIPLILVHVWIAFAF